MLVTAAEITRFAPHSAAHRRQAIAEALSETMPAYGIDTPLRIQHFLAQIAHECGGFTITRENMRYRAERIVEIFGVGRHSARVTAEEAQRLAGNGPALANRVYGLGNPKKAAELGNTGPNDGWLYRGGGWLQLTGKGAYARVGAKIGIDLVANPDLTSASPLVAARIACAEFVSLNDSILFYCDADDILRVTRSVNGGRNGLADRIAYLKSAKEIWPASTLTERLKTLRGVTGRASRVPATSTPATITVAAPDDLSASMSEATRALTREIQTKLNALGYRCGTVDGFPGNLTRDAIAAFEADNDLPMTGRVDERLLPILVTAAPRPLGDGRQGLTAADLPESRIVTEATRIAESAKSGKVLGWASGLFGGLGIVKETGLDLGALQSAVSHVQSILTTIQPYWPLIALAAAAWFLAQSWSTRRAAEAVIEARVEDARQGKTL